MAHLLRVKFQPEKAQRTGIFTDTGKMYTTVARQDEPGHVLERPKYLLQLTRPATIN